MTVLFIILPISRVDIAVGIAIDTVTMFLLASNAALIAVSVAEVLDGYHFCLHLIVNVYISDMKGEKKVGKD